VVKSVKKNIQCHDHSGWESRPTRHDDSRETEVLIRRDGLVAEENERVMAYLYALIKSSSHSQIAYRLANQSLDKASEPGRAGSVTNHGSNAAAPAIQVCRLQHVSIERDP
jgi:hypothetical protein